MAKKVSEDGGMSYRAMCPHGRAIFLISEEVGKEELAEELSRCILDGLYIERVTDEQARTSPFLCSKCCP